MRRPRRSWRIDGTNSIGGFSFGLHGYGGLSCNGESSCGVLPCVCVQAISGVQGVVVGWMRADEVRLRAKMGRQCYTSPWASLRNDERVWRW
jgi:hypothetical protein